MNARTGLALGLLLTGSALVMALGLAPALDHSRTAALVPAGVRSAQAPTPGPTPTLVAPTARPTLVHLVSAEWHSETLTVTVELEPVAGDYFYSSPELQIGDRVISPEPASLQAARRATLALARGQAVRVPLVFTGVPAEPGSGRLRLNPGSQAGDSARPPAEISVTWSPSP